MDSTSASGKPTPAILRGYNSGLAEETPHHKSKLAYFLSSRTVDILILCLVLLDLACVSVESSIDLHLACVNGAIVPMQQGQLVELGKAQGNSVEKGDASLLERSAAPASVIAVTASGGVETTEETYATVAHVPSPTSVLSRARRSKAMRPRPPQRRLEPLDDGLQRNFTHLALATKAAEDEESTALVCETRHGPKAHHIAHTAHKFSVYILVFFTLELFLKIYANPRHFFSNFWEVLDLVVVLVSLAFDTVVEGRFEEAAEVLILIRLWRVVRIIHGFVEVMDSDTEYIKELQEELERTKERCRKLEKEMKPTGAA